MIEHNNAAESRIAGENGFGAVILAAGYSSRMKAFKPLLDVGGVSALERLVRELVKASVGRIVIVTGHEREMLQPVIAELAHECGAAGSGLDGKPVHIIEACNEDYDSGMFSSIKMGLSAGSKAFGNVGGFFLMPVDCPLISADVIAALTERLVERIDKGIDGETPAEDAGRFFVPVFQGKKGHPLFIPSGYIREICSYDGPGGLKAITDKYHDRMVRVPVEEEGCVMDMDTPEGYEEIRRFLADGCRRRPLAELAAGRRIFLVRHGETMHHAEKMFIGRYDVPLMDGAEEDIREMARHIVAEGPQVKRIYTSPLKRARQTADILRDVLGGLQDCIIEDFREIDLGEWDGRPINWVKEHYPEEYRQRGEDIFVFKIGNRAENFYDVQYRAVKALGRILEEDDSRDIIIVTHSTVIRALENNLKGLRVEDEWNRLRKGDFRILTKTGRMS